MIQLFQEQIPLSNKRYDKPISQNSKYTNPVIIPSVLDTTGSENIMETVIYIKNTLQNKYYKHIVISLMKEDGSLNPQPSSGQIDFSDNNKFSINGHIGIDTNLAFEYQQSQTGLVYLTNKYMSNYKPIIDDGIVDVKFSYGYDEISYLDWSLKKSILIIPTIGTQGLSDTSYIPVRMRMKWKNVPSYLTIRDYFIDISFSEEQQVIV